MKNKPYYLLLLSLILIACSPSQSVSSEIEINTSTAKVWDIITNPQYAKILGSEFDKNAFVESDWKLGSDVHFKYEPDKIVSTGKISKLIEEELIQIDYSFYGQAYTEKYEIKGDTSTAILKLFAGPYSSDYEAQVEVWRNWLAKVKELGEKE